VHPELLALVHLQSIDGQITAFEQDLKKIPSLIESENSYLRDFEESVKNAETDFEAMQKRQREAEGEIQGAEEKLREIRGKQTLVKTNEEYRALNREIEALETKIGGLEERVLECMEGLEPLREEVAESQKGLGEARNKVKIFIEKHKDTQARLEDQLGKCQRDREGAWGEVGADWQSRYEAIRKGRGGAAVVPVIDRTCQGCRMSETIQRFFEIRDSKDEIFSCSNCGRIIYYKEVEAVIPVSPADDSD
jgi:predicted  nucleic acid-binding Zn-ribbon protein